MDETKRKTEEEASLDMRGVRKTQPFAPAPHFTKGMESADKAIRRYGKVLAELAK